MATELKPLHVFFNERVFRIPDYQRGYAWGTDQLEDFWQDLKWIPEKRLHYTGQITMQEVPEESYRKWGEDTWLITKAGCKPFYIVDGQQRLTTAVILLKCLIDVEPKGGTLGGTPKTELIGKYLFRETVVSRSYLFGYEGDKASYEYLKTQILGQPSNSYEGTKTVYTANLEAARNFFKKRLEELEPQGIEDLFQRLTRQLAFHEYQLDADLEAFVVFETMNNRGKPPSNLELLKNRLIYLSTLPQVDSVEQSSLRLHINAAWKTIYEFLGKESNSPLDDDEFLRAHWIMYFRYAHDEPEKYAKSLLKDHFTSNQVTEKKLTALDIQKFVDSIQNSVKAWHALHFPYRAQDLKEEVKQGLERCRRLGRGAFAPAIMAALQKKEPEGELVNFLAAAERFVFLVRGLCHLRSNTGDSEFYRLAGQLHRGEKSLTEATGLVQKSTERHFGLDRAQLEMSELFRRDAGFYSWSGRYYFLFEYEQRLKAEAGMEAPKINWEEFTSSKKDEVTVEHIYPQSPVPGEWPAFKASLEAERHSLRHTLGNLLLLSQSRNSEFSNRSFAVKKKGADEVRGYFNGSFSEIAVAQNADWTPKEILERGVKMLGFLEEHWSISLGSRADKIKLLRLEFLGPNPIPAQPT